MAANKQPVLELVKQVDHLAEEKRNPFSEIKKLLKEESDNHVAALLDLHPDNRWLVFNTLDQSRHSKVLDLVSRHTLRFLVNKMSDYQVVQLIEDLPSLISQKVVNALERQRLNRLLPMILNENRRKYLLNYVNYPGRSVGRIMQPELLTVNKDLTIKGVIREISGFDVADGPIYQVNVVDKKGVLTGTLPISEVVRAPSSAKIKDLYLKKSPVITPLTSQFKAAQLFQDYDLIEAPVTSKGQPVGRILVDDIIDVLEQEFSEDIHKFAGITADETMDTPVFTSSRRRLPWMIGNIFLDLIAVSVIMPFEETIAQLTALAVLMPIVSDMGGNVGIQSLTVSIRSLSSNRPDWKLAARELYKEVRVGMLNGLILGVIIGFIGFIWWGNPYLGAVVAVALSLNTVLASVVGGVLPIILRRLKKDPAMMSGAVLTTITDFFGFLLFLGLARTFMHYLI